MEAPTEKLKGFDKDAIEDHTTDSDEETLFEQNVDLEIDDIIDEEEEESNEDNMENDKLNDSQQSVLNSSEETFPMRDVTETVPETNLNQLPKETVPMTKTKPELHSYILTPQYSGPSLTHSEGNPSAVKVVTSSTNAQQSDDLSVYDDGIDLYRDHLDYQQKVQSQTPHRTTPSQPLTHASSYRPLDIFTTPAPQVSVVRTTYKSLGKTDRPSVSINFNRDQQQPQTIVYNEDYDEDLIAQVSPFSNPNPIHFIDWYSFSIDYD